MPDLDRHALRSVQGSLAEVVIEPERWPAIIAGLAEAAGARGGTLMDARGTMLPNSDSVADAMAAYRNENWFEHDLRRRAIAHRTTIVRDQDIVSPEEMRHHPMYADLLTRFDVPWWASVNFRTPNNIYALSLFRSRKQGFFDNDEAGALKGLSVQLRQAVSLSELVSTRATHALVSSLDHLGVAVFALDRDGRVLQHNLAADAYLGRQLTIRARRLGASDPLASETLRTFLEARMPASSSDILILVCGSMTSLVLQSIPVPASIASPFGNATRLITVRDLQDRKGPPEAALMAAYGLTRAEARVAALLAKGHSIESLADLLAISRETARSQLRAVFIKTGYRRQSEMTAALARICL